jgi:hypothetical protein
MAYYTCSRALSQSPTDNTLTCFKMSILRYVNLAKSLEVLPGPTLIKSGNTKKWNLFTF